MTIRASGLTLGGIVCAAALGACSSDDANTLGEPKTMLIEARYQLPFPTPLVYSAWISPSTVIAPATAMDINPVVGGHYRLLIDTPEFKSRAEGTFSDLQTNRHVRYTWEWDNNGEVTEIDVRFSPSADNTTQIDLVHSGFISAESHDMHRAGWDSYMEGLIAFLQDSQSSAD